MTRFGIVEVAIRLDGWLHDRGAPGVWWCDLTERIIWWGQRGEPR